MHYLVEAEMNRKIYGGWHNDEQIRKNSSSGGVFSALAGQIINSGGYVYGAALQIDKGEIMCLHKECSSIDEVAELRGSKYMVSELGDIFSQVKRRLQAKHWVLFCGTPCQVEGLLSYLGKNFEKLVTVDFICHGIPSPLLLEKVRSELEEEYGAAVSSIDFRNKESGWEKYSLRIEFQNGRVYSEIGMDSNYMRLFFSDMFLRESCYNCECKGIDRKSDITLGDFWGINKYHRIDDEERWKGISLVLPHSEKGNTLLHNARKSLTLFETSEDIFADTNIYIRERAKKPVDWFVFRNKLGTDTTNELLGKISKGKPVRSIARKIAKKLSFNVIQKESQGLPDIRYCYSCGACAAVCPVKAITMVKQEMGFMYPIIDKEKCCNCHLCEKACPRK